jgi:hypothetical protein
VNPCVFITIFLKLLLPLGSRISWSISHSVEEKAGSNRNLFQNRRILSIKIHYARKKYKICIEYLRRKPDGENCNLKIIVIFKGKLSSKGVALLALMKLAHINGSTEKQEKKARMVHYLI